MGLKLPPRLYAEGKKIYISTKFRYGSKVARPKRNGSVYVAKLERSNTDQYRTLDTDVKTFLVFQMYLLVIPEKIVCQ